MDIEFDRYEIDGVMYVRAGATSEPWGATMKDLHRFPHGVFINRKGQPLKLFTKMNGEPGVLVYSFVKQTWSIIPAPSAWLVETRPVYLLEELS